ncbi:MAG TPA: hypothetical protein ENK66_05175 [Arcobacter sp.]|nr:hypothetical protein [Arcobacter sp.]
MKYLKSLLLVIVAIMLLNADGCNDTVTYKIINELDKNVKIIGFATWANPILESAPIYIKPNGTYEIERDVFGAGDHTYFSIENIDSVRVIFPEDGKVNIATSHGNEGVFSDNPHYIRLDDFLSAQDCESDDDC